ncbi:MAG: TraR/DksA family transcriptional regulator [Nitrospinae bacterium]|nr:TraR/DksA family transcriptional regulator [Nitrospinota bacterium]
MDNKKLEKLKEKLLDVRGKLCGGVEKALKECKDEVKGGVPDISDDASRTYTRNVLLNLSERERDILKLVELALSKFEENKYGVCDSCEGKIPEGRLEAVPYTKYCVRCQNEMEGAEKKQ